MKILDLDLQNVLDICKYLNIYFQFFSKMTYPRCNKLFLITRELPNAMFSASLISCPP